MRSSSLFLTLAMVMSFGIIAHADNSALQFDGVDDYVACDVDGVQNLPEGNAPRTEETWFKTEHPGGGLVTMMGYGTNSVNQMLNVLIDGTMITISQWGDRLDVIAPDPINDGGWHHVAVVHDGENTQTIYVDGEAMEPQGGWSLDTVANFCKIGCRIDTAVEFFPGTIDEVRFWEVARTEEEIREAMSVSLAGDEPGLVGYWNFDEGSGEEAADATGNNHGQLINGPEWVASDIPNFVVTSVSHLDKLAITWGRVKNQ